MRPGRVPALGRSCQIHSRRSLFICRLAQLYIISNNTINATFSSSVIHCIVSGLNTNLELALGLIRLALSLKCGFGFLPVRGGDAKFSHAKQPQRFQVFGAIFHIYQLSKEKCKPCCVLTGRPEIKHLGFVRGTFEDVYSNKREYCSALWVVLFGRVEDGSP